ncbi:2344_t:CDS:2, partial [Scutellospora calospora]
EEFSVKKATKLLLSLYPLRRDNLSQETSNSNLQIKQTLVYAKAHQAFYINEHLDYIYIFYQQEAIKNPSASVNEIASTFRNIQSNSFIRIFLKFITINAQFLVSTLDFFQTEKEPVFPFIETCLNQLDQFLINNKNSTNFRSDLNTLIISFNFQSNDFIFIFQSVFDKAYQKYETHIINHPARSFFQDSQIFDP